MRILIAFCFVTTLAGAGKLAAAPMSGPEALAESYFLSMRDKGFASAVDFMHPKALEDFKAMLLPVFEAEAESGKRDLLNATFGSQADIDDVRSAEPYGFMKAFMNIVMAMAGDVDIQFRKIEILGSIREGEIVHVLARMTVGADDLAITKMEVISFRPHGDTWAMLLNGEMEGMAKALRARMAG